MKKVIILIIGLLLPAMMWGQYAHYKERPAWIDGFFQEKQNSYIEVVSAFSYDEESARNKAASVAISRRSLATGAQANVLVRGSSIIVSGSDNLTVKSRIIDEYSEYLPEQGYRVYLLVQTAKNPTYDLEPVALSEKYPFSARAFVPGMAQIYKGSVTKGALFISGEVLFIGGIIVGELMAQSNYNKSLSTYDTRLKAAYIQNANTCRIVRDVSIAGAAVVYVWSLIDGIAAKGKRHVLVGDLKLTLNPYVDRYSSGLALNIDF